MADLTAQAKGGLTVSRDDRKLVDEAVATITGLWRQGLLATVVAVGDYLVEAFFDGSIELAASHHEAKPNALRHLYERVGELPIGIHQLRLAVRVAAQWHRLPPDVADALTVSHHELLLLIDDQAEKERLARQAVDDNLTVEALERLVRRLQPKQRGGRPPLPLAVRWVRAFVRTLELDEFDGALDERELRKLPPEQLQSLEGDLRRVRDRVDEALARCVKTTKRLGA